MQPPHQIDDGATPQGVGKSVRGQGAGAVDPFGYQPPIGSGLYNARSDARDAGQARNRPLLNGVDAKVVPTARAGQTHGKALAVRRHQQADIIVQALHTAHAKAVKLPVAKDF